MNRRPLRRKKPSRRYPAKPRPAKADTDRAQQQLDRIREISQNARATWFGLLAILVFVSVTLVGHRDVDFFLQEASTQLPVVNMAVPTLNFFYAAPVLVAALYAYLHIYLLNLWSALADAPPQVDGYALSDKVHPTLLGQAALWWRHHTREDGASSLDRTVGEAMVVAGVVLVWVYGLFVLVWLWSLSTTRHDFWLTFWILFWLGIAATAGIYSFRVARHNMEVRDDAMMSWPLWLRLRSVYAALMLIGFSWLFTEGPERAIRWVAGAPSTDPAAWRGGVPLSEQLTALARWPLPVEHMPVAALAERPDGWVPYSLWAEDFEDAFRQRHGLAARHPDAPIPERHLSVFETERDERYRHYLSTLRPTPLSGTDLRGANLRGAFLAGSDLRAARLQGADFSGVEMQGANLSGAEMQGANLRRAQMQGVDFTLAQAHGANLEGAELQGAILRLGEMHGANLEGADMRRANLRFVKMYGANLRIAGLQGASLSFSRAQGADLSFADLQGATLWNAKLQGVILRDAQMQGTSLIETKMQWADFTGAQLKGVDARSADFSRSLLASGDFTGVRNLVQGQLDAAVGDEATVLPHDAVTGAQLYVLSCWKEPGVLESLIERWRIDEERAEALRKRWLCNGREPYRTGRPEPRHHCPPTCSHPEG